MSDDDTEYGAVAIYTCNVGYIVNGDETITCQENEEWSGSAPTCMHVNCGDPGDISNGNKNGTTYHYGAVVSYSCDTGYYINGSQTLQCQADGNWNGTVPSCDVVACTIPQIAYGNVSGNNIYNSKVVISCDMGYELNGTSTLMCQANGMWNDLIPSCDVITCIVLQIDYGNITGNNTYNSMIAISCDIGYELHGSSKLTCQANGTWNDATPTCDMVTCTTPQIDYGSITGNNTYNSAIVISCDVGYELNDTSSLICQANGVWNASTPTCNIKSCSDPGPAPINGGMNGTIYTYNSVIRYSCNDGYMVNGSEVIVCRANGTWSDGVPTCDIVTCTVSQIDYGNITGTNTYNSTIEISCDTGYEVYGSSILTCQANGTWSDSIPTCSIKSCSDPGPTPINGGMNGTMYTYNSIVRYFCDDGYTVNGSDVIVCQDNGNWSSTPPTCTPVMCDSLMAPNNGEIADSSNTFGSRVSFTCDSGYIMNDPSILFCQADGMWNGTVPSCIAQCLGELLINPVHGSKNPDTNSTFLAGAVVKFSCDDPYIINGSPVVICQEDGQWSDTAPTCEEHICPDPGTPDNGSQNGNYTLASLVRFSCNTGYNLIGNAWLECDLAGWKGPMVGSDAIPICDPVNCFNPGVPDGGYQKPGTGLSYTYQSVVVFDCNEGLAIEGNGTLICQADGTWSGQVPSCTRVSCDKPEELKNGQIIGSDYSYQSTVMYQCNSGYKLNSTSSIATCQADKTWDINTPHCLKICDSLVLPENMLQDSLSDKEFIEGDSVTLSCVNGYTLDGESVVTCTSSGEWSHTLPVCLGKYPHIGYGGWYS